MDLHIRNIEKDGQINDIVFDKFVDYSLKKFTRGKRGNEIIGRVQDESNILGNKNSRQ